MSTSWLTRALEESRARGFLGPGPIEPHIEHARGFGEAWSQHSPVAPTKFLDLGSGGGLPGYFLLTIWESTAVLLDSMVRRTSFLEEALLWPDAPTTASVVTARAEDAARSASLEGAMELVVARSFGPPAVVAECAVRFLSIGGLLIVSEPPLVDESLVRWPPNGLEQLGLESAGQFRSASGYQVLRKVAVTPPQFPRRSGQPAKRPLF